MLASVTSDSDICIMLCNYSPLCGSSVPAKQEVPGLEARPVLSPTQGLTPLLLHLYGKACGLAAPAKPGPRLSPPSQLPTPESQAERSRGRPETLERVTASGWGGGRVIHGQEPTYCVHSLSLSHHFTHPSPNLTCSSFILQLTESVLLGFFFFPLPFAHPGVVSLLPSQRLPPGDINLRPVRSVQSV